MKEKLKRFFDRLLTWKGILMLNVAFMIVYIVLSVVHFHPAFVMTALFHFGYVALCLKAWIEEKSKEYYRMEAEHFEYMAHFCLEKWKRYETMYGKLPPEEEENENNQDNQEKEE